MFIFRVFIVRAGGSLNRSFHNGGLRGNYHMNIDAPNEIAAKKVIRAYLDVVAPGDTIIDCYRVHL